MKLMTASNSIGEIICEMPLLDKKSGERMESFDPKHLVKRCWTAAIWESMKFDGIPTLKCDLKELLS